jgi:hypothetical protein
MSEPANGAITTVYDGSSSATRLFYHVTGLTTGARYSFFVAAVNANGEGQPSPELMVVVCKPPDGFPRPFRVTSTTSSITLGWKPPSDLGGCALLRYALYINDGLGGTAFQEAD